MDQIQAERAEVLIREPFMKRRALNIRQATRRERDADVDAAEMVDMCLRMDEELAAEMYWRHEISLEAFEALVDVGP